MDALIGRILACLLNCYLMPALTAAFVSPRISYGDKKKKIKVKKEDRMTRKMRAMTEKDEFGEFG